MSSIDYAFNEVLMRSCNETLSEIQAKGLTKRTIRTYIFHATGHISKRTYPLGTLGAEILRTVFEHVHGGDIQ